MHRIITVSELVSLFCYKLILLLLTPFSRLIVSQQGGITKYCCGNKKTRLSASRNTKGADRMMDEKKPAPTHRPIGVSTRHVEDSYNPNKGILRPNPPQRPVPQQTPPKK